MQRLLNFFRLSAYSIMLSFFMIISIFIYKKYIPYELFLREAIPFYKSSFNAQVLFMPQTKKVFKEQKLNSKKNMAKQNIISEIINEQNIEFQEHDKNKSLDYLYKNLLASNKNFGDISYLKTCFYNTDKKTELTLADFDVKKLLNTNVAIENKNFLQPKVLIFHTHSTEMFKDSDPNNIYDGVVGLGKKLCDLLNQKYNISAIHHTKRYDFINNKPDKRGAYERMEPEITRILKENPSIEVAIDIHRDGVADSVHLVENINNKPTAKIMFVNGICKLLKNDVLVPIKNLPNPYINTNLALSLKMQILANKLYPGLNRKIYVNAYRYSLNMLPKSLLIEVGAQTNSKQEALNAIDFLAEILAKVLLDE